jgi:hypothetical protein
MTQTGFSLEPQADDLVVMERRFDAALLSRDVQALDAILAERFFLNDFMGGVVIRSELLKYLGSAALKFHAIVPHELSVQRYGDAGLVTGWTEMKTELQGEVSEVKSRFLHVYIKHAGSWQLVSAQGTVIPELD